MLDVTDNKKKQKMTTLDSDKFLNITLKELSKLKQKEYANVNITIKKTVGKSFPKNSTILGRNFLKEVTIEDNPRLLVIKGHLFLELYINEILNRNVKNFDKLEKYGILNTFFKKIRYLESQEILDNLETSHLLTLNSLRNKFAHDVYQSLDRFDIHDFEYIKMNFSSSFKTKIKKNKIELNRIILKNLFLWFVFRLTKKFRFLHLLDSEI